jgi:uncharacterized membrane protein YdjX (TVP38/TMEM64 family)
MTQTDESPTPPARARSWVAAALVAAVLVSAGILVWQSTRVRGELHTAWSLLLQGDPEPLQLWLVDFGPWAPLFSLLLYLLSALIPILPGFVLAIANATLFGAIRGGILSFVSAIVAAAICFGLARSLGRPGVIRIVSRER